MNLLAFGYCVVAAMVLAGVIALCVSGIRALLRRSTAFFLVFTAASSLTTITAQKTNNVNNIPPQQMMAGGWVSQTGFTELTGFVGALPHTPSSLNPVQNNIPVQTTIEDIARGWLVECVATNAAVSYAMPTNAALVGKWHVHGAASSFGMNRINFNGFSFPLGTNGASFSSFWYFIDGRIRPTPKDAEREICAVGVPMSAVPGQSRLWRLDGDDGSRILTWENFFFGGDTNCPVNAQIELFPNGDFVTRSNGVETVCRRVNPDDWDDDGIENGTDPNPLFCDGDFFGPANILPEGANTNAYCTVSVVATGPDALVVFEGDGPSNYPDPRFVARHGVTNEVFILIGKTYTVSSDWPIDIVGSSDPDTEVVSLRGPGVRVCRPVSISAGDGNPFTMYVEPSDLGGVFSWIPTGCGCTLSGSGVTFLWNCSTNCTCCGQSAEGTYTYEGFWLPATSCLCGCYYNGEGPTWTDDNEDPDNSGPFAASVSATFSKSAVIFEDAYENLPGQWIGKRSTRTRLNIIAHGGPNGAALSVASENLAKLSHLSGPGLPLAPVSIPANTSVSYAIVYEGNEASSAADDISVTATLTENVMGSTFADSCAATSVRLELSSVYEAPENSCTNRHVFGVGERVNCIHTPAASVVEWSCNTMAGYGNCFLGTEGMVSQSDGEFLLAYFAELSPTITLTCNDVSFQTVLEIVEPEAIFVPEARLAYQPQTLPGEAGGMEMDLWQYVRPNHVSFLGIDLSEVPCTNAVAPIGYFANPSNATFLVHSVEAGAGRWNHVKVDNYWTTDSVHMAKKMPPWEDGSLTWKIPVGWRPAWAGSGPSWPIGVEPIEDFRCGRAIVGDSEDLYHQVFGMEADGTASISKFGHVIVRGTNGVVRIDGLQIGQ